ncbi:hypothetical protein PCC21_009060 [Pectobacterium carotovorum subsp. carotovorum PCC21]|nr:hypothetical protein PCC21_009060 [Pectobacterium carotovorum subsp. carotovorum PCC21]
MLSDFIKETRIMQGYRGLASPLPRKVPVYSTFTLCWNRYQTFYLPDSDPIL